MPTASTSDLSLLDTRGLDAAMAHDYAADGSADDEVEFAVSMTARLRTAARAADELAASYRELARRFAEEVDPELASDVDPSALPIGQAFREVSQQGHAILATLYEHRTASDSSSPQQAAAGIELSATPSLCKRCPLLLVWARDEAGGFVPLDPEPLPALAIAAHQRWLPDRNFVGNDRPPRVRRAPDQTEGYAYRRHSCPGG